MSKTNASAAAKYRKRLRFCLAQFIILLIVDVVMLAIFDDRIESDFFGDPWVYVGTIPVLVWSFVCYIAVLASGERVLYRDCDVTGFAEIKKVTGAAYAELSATNWQSACAVDFYTGRFDRVLAIEPQLKTFYVRQNPEMLMMFAVAGYYANYPAAIAAARSYFAQGQVAGRGGKAYAYAETIVGAAETLAGGDGVAAKRALEALDAPRRYRIWNAVRDALASSACRAAGDAHGVAACFARLKEYGNTFFAEQAKRSA